MELSHKKIIEYSKKYDLNNKGTFDELVEKEIKEWFKGHRYLDKEHFVKLGLWKSRRPKKRYESNDTLFLKEITKFALFTKNEEARIKSLTILSGVSWPVASVILHFAFPNEYPILDFRAIWSLGWGQPKNYGFDFWKKYCEEIRKLSKNYNVSLRQLDKALWYYSKENQK